MLTAGSLATITANNPAARPLKSSHQHRGQHDPHPLAPAAVTHWLDGALAGSLAIDC